jgi:hypothetical protein
VAVVRDGVLIEIVIPSDRLQMHVFDSSDFVVFETDADNPVKADLQMIPTFSDIAPILMCIILGFHISHRLALEEIPWKVLNWS